MNEQVKQIRDMAHWLESQHVPPAIQLKVDAAYSLLRQAESLLHEAARACEDET